MATICHYVHGFKKKRESGFVAASPLLVAAIRCQVQQSEISSKAQKLYSLGQCLSGSKTKWLLW